MLSGIARGRVRTTAATVKRRRRNGVAQDGGHPPKNRLAETCSLGLTCTLILDIHVMISWHLSKQGICWPVARDHIAGPSLQFIEVTFLKLTADQVLVFDWIAGSCQVNLLKTGVLTIYTGKPEIPDGESNGSRHSVWKASENVGCNMSWCYFSALWSLSSWCGYILKWFPLPQPRI